MDRRKDLSCGCRSTALGICQLLARLDKSSDGKSQGLHVAHQAQDLHVARPHGERALLMKTRQRGKGLKIMFIIAHSHPPYHVNWIIKLFCDIFFDALGHLGPQASVVTADKDLLDKEFEGEHLAIQLLDHGQLPLHTEIRMMRLVM
jgi:hypothetical protein